MGYKRKYAPRKKYYDGGTIDMSSSAVAPTEISSTYGSGYTDPSLINNTASQSSLDTGGNSTDWSSIASYGSTLSGGIADALNSDATPKTAQDKYVYGQVQDQDPGSTYEELSYAITDSNPISSLAHDIGAGVNDVLAPTNEEGYSDSSNFAVGVGGMIDPGATTDYAMSQFDEGDTWEGILGLVSPYYAADAQNREAEAAANKAKLKYKNNKLFNELSDSSGTKQYNQSTYGNSYGLKYGGNMSKGGNISKDSVGSSFSNPINSIDYYGPTHETGGIPIGSKTEVESGEAKHMDYVFSNSISYNK